MNEYKPLPSRVLTSRMTAAAREKLSPAERERLDLVCERLADWLRVGKRRNMVGPVYAREIVAALGRFMVERGL